MEWVSASFMAFGLTVAVLVPFLLVERRWRWRWQEVEVGRAPTVADTALYRAGGTVPTFARRAPGLVLAAAFSCLLFGQMFVPGLAAGAFGVFFGGIGLVSIPGLITAWKLYGAGLALLRREPRVGYFKARDAAAWSLWLNGVIFALSLVVVLGLRTRPRDVGVFFAFVNGYGLLSVMQALLLRHAVRRHEDALFLPTAATRLGRVSRRPRRGRPDPGAAICYRSAFSTCVSPI